MINSKHVFWFLLWLCIISYVWRVYAEITQDYPTDDYIWKFWNHVWYDLRWKNLKEWKYEDHVKPVTPKPIVKAQIKPVEQRKEEKPIQVPPTVNKELDLNKLAYAIAMSETWNCTKGYWKEYNNCFWIKNGNTAPCPKIWRNRMCIYEKPEDSYEAFKKVWSTWYKTFPTRRQATIWTGADNADRWLSHVKLYYSK